MNTIRIVSGDEITRDYIRQALELDRISYGGIYQLDLDRCISYYRKNPDIYIMAIDGAANRVVAYVNFSPLTKEAFCKIKSGAVIDTVITADDLVRYEDGCHCYGYLSSIVVHPAYRGQGLARKLIGCLETMLCRLADERNILFDGLIADAVSDGGHHILTTLGFRDTVTSTHRTRIMELDLRDTATPETEYNKRLLKIYNRKRDNHDFQI